MAITYKWVISSMDEYPQSEGLTDVVFNVHWRRQAEDEQYFAEVYGCQAVSQPDPSQFTPYDQLTFEQVCGWLEASMDVPAMDASLAQQIEDLNNPKVVSLPLPW